MDRIETTVSDAGNATFDPRHASRLPSVEALDGRDPEPARMCVPSNVSEVEVLDAREAESARVRFLSGRSPEVESLDGRDAGSARACVCANPPFFPTPEV